jgi:hypothetical protein
MISIVPSNTCSGLIIDWIDPVENETDCIIDWINPFEIETKLINWKIDWIDPIETDLKTTTQGIMTE